MVFDILAVRLNDTIEQRTTIFEGFSLRSANALQKKRGEHQEINKMINARLGRGGYFTLPELPCSSGRMRGRQGVSGIEVLPRIGSASSQHHLGCRNNTVRAIIFSVINKCQGFFRK